MKNEPRMNQAVSDRRALARVTRETNFKVLAAILELAPTGGTLRTAEIATRANVPVQQVLKTLPHFQKFRVLWLRRRHRTFEIRFQREVLVGLLAAQRTMPHKVRGLMHAHRAKREAIAPRLERKP